MKRDATGYNPDALAQMERLGCSFSTSKELVRIGDRLRPVLRHKARSPAEHAAWRRSFGARLRRALGERMESVPLKPRVVERVDCGDYVREKVVYRTTRDMSVPAYVLTPKRVLESGVRVPAVLAIHGHGYGAVDLVGLSPEEKTGGNVHKNYAVDAVRRGMVALAPELRGFGQRAVDEDQLGATIRRRGDPEAKFFKRDMCNAQNLKADLLGYTFMGLQLHDLRCGLDYLCSRPEVRPSRIGACGLSAGGMLTMFLSALDLRVKAAVISGTLTSYRSYALRIETVCGSQLPHGIMRFGDLADVACMIAPRPVCFEAGSEDFGFYQSVARKEFVRIRRCYGMLGAGDRAVLDAFDGGHEWHGSVGMPMMEAWLKR